MDLDPLRVQRRDLLDLVVQRAHRSTSPITVSSEPAIAIIKHTNPACFAAGEEPGGVADLYTRALTEGDFVSAYGGIVATNDAALADTIRIGRDYGNPGDYDTRFVGLNARMSEFHAAMALTSLDALRGFDMFWILGADAVMHGLGKLFNFTPVTQLAAQFEHKAWAGFAFYDLIFPLFVFMGYLVERANLIEKLFKSLHLATARVPVYTGTLDGARLPFADARFDAALSTMTLCTIPDVSGAAVPVQLFRSPDLPAHWARRLASARQP